jgi:chromate reductase, NAD(P)H dehydrogenase (quinone)
VSPATLSLVLYEGVAALPHFNADQDSDPLPPGVAELRAAIRAADAVLFSTPEYAGALPGSFKNVLDWSVGDDHRGSLYGKPVAWFNASPRGAPDAHASLRKVLGFVGARIIESACADLPIEPKAIGTDGLIGSTQVRSRVEAALGRLAAQL